MSSVSSRYLAAAIVGFGGLGAAALWLRHRAPAPDTPAAPAITAPEVFAPAGFKEMMALLGMRKGRAGRFAQAVLSDPAMRAAYERASAAAAGNPDPSQLAAALQGVPGFPALLAKFQEEEDAFGSGDSAPAESGAPAGPVADRMMVHQASSGPGEGPEAGAHPGVPQSGSGRGSGIPSVILSMPPQQRARILSELENGRGLAEACRRTELDQVCEDVRRRCESDAACAPWLARVSGRAPVEAAEVDSRGGANARGDQGPNGGPDSGRVAPDPSEDRRTERRKRKDARRAKRAASGKEHAPGQQRDGDP